MGGEGREGSKRGGGKVGREGGGWGGKRGGGKVGGEQL